mmetsp:Transcript_18269/g.27686  ORF Transcript_18269/g.27686 Transcript_18269/m.27686 type:complete len:81 (+) Transcript_18269:2697-2939(+)
MVKCTNLRILSNSNLSFGIVIKMTLISLITYELGNLNTQLKLINIFINAFSDTIFCLLFKSIGWIKHRQLEHNQGHRKLV